MRVARTHRRLTSGVFLLFALSAAAAAAAAATSSDPCVGELCWSASLSDRCAAECLRRWRIRPQLPTDKRAPSSFVGTGKFTAGGDASKRYSSFVRIGRLAPAAAAGDKRYSSFVRIGQAKTSRTSASRRRLSQNMTVPGTLCRRSV